jgi:hypothetical protein
LWKFTRTIVGYFYSYGVLWCSMYYVWWFILSYIALSCVFTVKTILLFLIFTNNFFFMICLLLLIVPRFWKKRKTLHYIAFYSQWIKFQLNRLKFESMLLWNIYSKLSVSNVICFLMNLGQFLVLFRFTSENVLREFVVIHYRYFIYYSLALYNNRAF